MIIPEPLYEQIKKSMPIPCVDLLILDADDHVLLVRRIAPPAEGEWWFPGGRVHFGESRRQAAVRKLREECAIESGLLYELATLDVFLPLPRGGGEELSHGITTVFLVRLDRRPKVVLDSQSSAFDWRRVEHWLQSGLHILVHDMLATLRNLRSGEGE